MPREFAPLRTSIWNNDDFRDLDADEQWLYFVLMSQRGLSMCGVLPYTPRKWARLAKDKTTDQVEEILASLVAKRYVVIDESTEELLVRTIVRHDPARGERSRKGLWKTWEHVESEALRAVILAEAPEDLWTTAPPEALSQRKAPCEGASLTPYEGASDTPLEGANDGASLACVPAGTRPPSSMPPSSSSQLDNGLTAVASGPALERELLRIIDAVANRRLIASKARGTAIADEDSWLRRVRGNLHRESATAIKQDINAGIEASIITDRLEPPTPQGIGPQRTEGADQDLSFGAGLARIGAPAEELEDAIALWPENRQQQARNGYQSIQGAA